MHFSFLLAIILSFIVWIISLTASFFISLSLFSLFLTDSLLSQHPSLSEGFGIKLHDTNASISSLLHIFSSFVFIGIRPTTVRWRSNPQQATACCHSGSALVWHVFDFFSSLCFSSETRQLFVAIRRLLELGRVGVVLPLSARLLLSRASSWLRLLGRWPHWETINCGHFSHSILSYFGLFSF